MLSDISVRKVGGVLAILSVLALIFLTATNISSAQSESENESPEEVLVTETVVEDETVADDLTLSSKKWNNDECDTDTLAKGNWNGGHDDDCDDNNEEDCDNNTLAKGNWGDNDDCDEDNDDEECDENSSWRGGNHDDDCDEEEECHDGMNFRGGNYDDCEDDDDDCDANNFRMGGNHDDDCDSDCDTDALAKGNWDGGHDDCDDDSDDCDEDTLVKGKYWNGGHDDCDNDNDNDNDCEESSSNFRGGNNRDNDCGTIIIKKVTTPATSTVAFEFDPSWDDTFMLQDGESEEFTVDADESYSIDEVNLPSGWSLTSAVCENEAGEDIGADDIYVGEDDTVTCTFTNDYDNGSASTDPGRIVIEKVVTGTSTATTTDFEFDISWGDNFMLSHGESRSFDITSSGTLSVNEVNLPANWTLESVVCDSNQGTTTISNTNIPMPDEDEVITCTFTNDYDDPAIPNEDPGKIIIKKVVGGDATSTATTTDFEFDISWSNSTVTLSHDETFEFVATGTGPFSVTEINIPANWSLGSVQCVSNVGTTTISNTSIPFPDEDEVITCTFTNNYDDGSTPGEGGNGGGGGGGGSNDDDDDGISTGSRSRSSSSNNNDDDGEVLGESISVLPLGAPNTGAGGTAPISISLPSLVAILRETVPHGRQND